MHKFIFLLLLAVFSQSALAGMVIQADKAELQPLIGRDSGGFQSCGVRAVVVISSNEYLEAYDFSLSIYSNSFAGLLKAGKSRTPIQAALNGKFAFNVVTPSPIKFWIAKELEGKAIYPIKTMEAETPGFIIEIADFSDTVDVIHAIIHGERVQFAVRYKEQPIDVIISFGVAMAEAERNPLLSCFNGVVSRMRKNIDDGSKN